MLALFYNNLAEKTGNGFVIPIWVMVLSSVTMGLGTSVGGMRIIKSVGMDMVKLETYQGFSSEEKDLLEIIKWKEIYDCFESIINDTERVVDIIDGMIIKNT